MDRKSIVHKCIRAGYGSIARTVDTKDNDSVFVSTPDTQYGIAKHIGDWVDRHEIVFESGEGGTREVQKELW